MKNLFLAAMILCSINSKAQDSATIYYNKGLEEKTAKRLRVAQEAFEKAIALNKNFTDAYLQNGAVLLEMRRTDKAKAVYTTLYELQPANKQAIAALTSLYFDYHQYDNAIKFAQKCDDCADAMRIIGMSYYQQEDYASAEKALLAALKKNPNDAEATYTLARTYLDMEDYKKAVPWYEKAIAMPGAKNNWMYELGLLYYNNTDYKNAVIAFTRAAENGYDQKNDFNENLGFAALYSGDYNRGEQLLQGILTRKPNNVTILRDMAQAFYEQRQYDKSLTYCEKLMKLDANDAKALYQAGLCFQKKGEKDRGQQMCDKAIAMDPSLESLRRKKEMPGM